MRAFLSLAVFAPPACLVLGVGLMALGAPEPAFPLGLALGAIGCAIGARLSSLDTWIGKTDAPATPVHVF